MASAYYDGNQDVEHDRTTAMATLDDIYRKISGQLAEAGIDTPERDAEAFIEAVTGLGSSDFITRPDAVILATHRDSLEKYVARRLAGEPVYRILGVREFWGLEFEVTPDTLDPRPDTETLIEAALKWVRQQNLQDAPLRIVDLGTGTGCILLSLLSELPNASGVAVDYSYDAALVARRNAQKLGLDGRFSIIQGDWMSALAPESFDLIVSNPPYIPNLDIATLSPEVKNHDPILSLSGGNDGLDCYKKIVSALKIHLKQHSHAFLEIGIGQLPDLSRLVDESNLCLCDSVADIAGIPRVVDISRGDK